MRAGKENGLLLPNGPGASGQTLVSNGNGVMVFSDGLNNAVTTNTTQTVTGAKTFSAATTTFGTSAAPAKLTTAGTQLVFEQTGAAMGGTRLTILNDTGVNGAQFEQLGTNDLIDFIFKTPSGQGNVRYERRPASFLDTQNLLYEFQIGTAAAPSLVTGDVVTRVNSSNLKVGANTVYHAGNLPGVANNVLYKSGTGLASASNVNVDNGYLRISTGLPTSTAAGGTVIGAKDLAGRVIPAFVGPAGVDAALQPHMGRNRVTQVLPVPGAATITVNGQAVTAQGTLTARTLATTSFATSLPRVGYAAASATGSIAGWRTTTAQWWRGNSANTGGFFYSHTFMVSTTAAQTGRGFVGLTATVAAGSNVEPTTLVNCVGMARLNGNTNWGIYASDASAAGSAGYIDLGTGFPANTTNTDVYRLTLFAPPGAAYINYRVERLNVVDSSGSPINVATGTITDTNFLPVNTSFMIANSWIATGTLTSAAGIDLINFYVETDT